jgi:hypothetical protein
MYACFLFAQDNYDFNIHLVFSVLFRQVVKKEIKLEAVDDSLLNDTILLNHRLMCNHPDHRSGQSQVTPRLYNYFRD